MGAAQHFVLRLVGEGECRAAVLAARLGIGAPVLSRHIADLEEQSLVVRRKDPGDGRAQLVAITPWGLERLRRLEAERSAAFQEHLWDWNEEDARSAAKTLHQLTQSLVKSAVQARSTTS
ncbi:MarR family winged helix-turn-helix transcriptional regulator [Pseudarthrobacter siccitolerans]|uniref:MarR family winged helix-turn-helix transcriptional regulator n=2 Tax=Micrococcaceae TaxID=1268 RepID=UPI0027BA4063|nr:MarR family transcriptional regulator [Pseudarthrobacter siccitolerans]